MQLVVFDKFFENKIGKDKTGEVCGTIPANAKAGMAPLPDKRAKSLNVVGKN